jgi:hypothetical protein
VDWANLFPKSFTIEPTRKWWWIYL